MFSKEFLVFLYQGRPARVGVLAAGIFVLSQLWAQMAMELHFPLALKFGPVTAVLFID